MTDEITPADDQLSSSLAVLSKEPLWHASLGSKELFHSNLIAWVAERFPDQTAEVFEPWTTANRGQPHLPPLREKRHLDIVLRPKDRSPLVIENKMFSMPSDQQLVDYSRSAVPSMGLSEPSLVLLSLVEPDWAKRGLAVDGYLWRWMSYGVLAQRLQASFPAVDRGFDDAVVNHYAHMLTALQEVADCVSLTDLSESLPAPSLVSVELSSKLGKLLEIASKLRANQLRRSIAEELDRRGLRGEYTRAGFTNASPLIEWKTTWEPRRNSAVWQFQSGQWRLALSLHEDGLLGIAHKEARERFASDRLDWFDFTSLNRIAGVDAPVPDREMGGGFYHYNPDFIYRYRKLMNPTAAQVVELAVSYSEAANKLEL